MRKTFPLIVLLISLLTLRAQAADPVNPHWPQKWNYVHVRLTNDADVAHVIHLLKQSKDAGCTHIAFGATGMGRVDMLNDPAYIARAAKIRAVADELHLALVPMVFSVGYGGETLRPDGNLMAGLPVKDMPFIIKGKTSEADPAGAPALNNGDFEARTDNSPQPAGWDKIPENMSIDATTKHAGNSSLKINVTGKDKPGDWEDDELLLRPAGTTLNQKIEVKPFQYFKISCWVKASDYEVNSNLFCVTGETPTGPRKLTRWHTPLSDAQKKAADWQKITVYFNTLDSKSILIQIGTRFGHAGGTLWVDDVKLEPAGMMLILHRDTVPVIVTSEDGKTTYTVGKDYEPIIDSAVGKFSEVGELDIEHAAPNLQLTPTSAIKDGQKVLVSFYNTTRINDDQDVVTMQDPRVLQIFDDNIKALVKVWPGAGYFMSGYDEIRITGWEPNPGGEKLSPGQIVSRHVTAAANIIKKYSPNSVVYVWEDMFSPYHNAKAGVPYFLCNGNYDKSWEGLPKDVVIMNWYAPKKEAISFFSDNDFHQVLCGYYDTTDSAALKKGVNDWFEKSAGCKNIDGMMYTTWNNNYKFLKEFFQLVDSYPN